MEVDLPQEKVMGIITTMLLNSRSFGVNLRLMKVFTKLLGNLNSIFAF